MNRFESFKEEYKSAINSIKDLINLEKNSDYPEYVEAATLCKFLFELDSVDLCGAVYDKHNHYQNFYDNAQMFDRLCKSIYHSIVDDGDICYAVVADRPRIVFISRWGATIDDCASMEELYMLRSIDEFRNKMDAAGPPLELKFLDNAYEFINFTKTNKK